LTALTSKQERTLTTLYVHHKWILTVALFALSCSIALGQFAVGVYPPPSAVTACSVSGANWLTCGLSGSTLALGAATGQVSNQVIGTCGSASVFGPCSLGIADLPSTLITSVSSLTSSGIMTGAGSQGTQTVTTKLSGGVFFPTADGTTAIQFDKANGTSNVLDIDTSDGFVGIGTTSPSNTFHVVGISRFVSAATVVSGTSGSATCVQPIIGNAKFVTCYLNAYANTSTAQTYSYPTAFSTTPVLLEGGGSCGTYNPTTTATTLTLPANASMTAETCDVVVMGQ
jgi:hypothetical protein